jgi:elongation factor Ts
MSGVTASLVKDLREKTGAGMMDCKNALVETGADLEAAVDWLRKKGHAAAAKKAGRATAEGMVGLIVDGNTGSAVELNSETDFVARNEKFQVLLSNILKASLSSKDLSSLEDEKYAGGDRKVKDIVAEHVGIVGENLTLKRCEKISVESGVVVSYVHNEIMPNAGKIAVLIAIESDLDKEILAGFGKQVAMHIAAAKPESLDRDGVSSASVEKEKEIFTEQAKASGKPESIIEKMVVGRIQKFYQEVVLLEQVFVMDNKTKISDLVDNFAKEQGKDVKIKGFIRYELGEENK